MVPYKNGMIWMMKRPPEYSRHSNDEWVFDRFTLNVVVGYLLQEIFREVDFPPYLLIYRDAYVCGNIGVIHTEPVSCTIRDLPPENLGDVLEQLVVCWNGLLPISFVHGELTVDSVAWQDGLIKLFGFSLASLSVTLQGTTTRIHTLTETGSLISPGMTGTCDGEDYYILSRSDVASYRSLLVRGWFSSFDIYTFIISLVSFHRLGVVFFSDPRLVSLYWDSLWWKEDREFQRQRVETLDKPGFSDILNTLTGVRLKIRPSFGSPNE